MTRRPYLLEVADALWPSGPSPSVHRRRAPGRGKGFVAVPSAAAPRLLVPDDRATAAGAIRAFGGHGSLTGRLRTQLTGGLFAAGLGQVLFADRIRVGEAGDGIVEELETLLGVPVSIALRAGPPRANRKPVLAVLDRRGQVLAFAKVAMNPLTERLLETEAAALGRLADAPLDAVRLPRLLRHGPWHGLTLLVQEALPVARSRAVGDAALVRAVGSVARALGTTSAPWAASSHAELVRDRLDRMPPTPDADVLAEAVGRLSADDEELLLGSWHGDWTPWNCTARHGSVLLWDWERFGTGVPVGFDLLHHDLQSALALDCTPDRPAALLAGAAERLAPLGLTPPQARRTAVAYLIELASRYLVDDQTTAGARAGAVGSWLLPVLTPAASDLVTPRGELSS